ncbi:myb/SANT-like DNA-binding domain-containing protein 4 [Hoplias malabaricus]|uniref:myb/SANT-like DNA-binding domain-containing protein 4 n=1 Tax=Hoplias malabaricus TaxID=27720 RepID=UPI003462A74B
MSSASYTYKLTEEDIKNLIRLRTTSSALFTRRRNAARTAWSAIIRELGLEDKVTVDQIAKKWENLKMKYKEIKFPSPGMEEAARTSHWRWYKLLDEALKEEMNETSFRSVGSSVSDDESGPQASKRVCQVKVGGDVLELLVDDEGIPGSTNSRSSGLNQQRLIDETPTRLSSLDIEKVKMSREQLYLDKEHAELERDRLLLEREKDLAEREKIALQRDRVQLEKDRAAVDRDRASLDQDRAQLEKDRAALERDKAAFLRDRENFNASLQGRTNPLDTPHEKNREKLILLIERLIDKF